MNKVILMGRLTKDPELKYTASNVAKCTFNLAVDRRFTKQGEEKQVDFFNIIAWQKQAEFCGKYLVKGTKVVLSGSIQNRSWDDNEGKKHYITEIIADDVEFAEGKKAADKPLSQSNDGGGYTQGVYTELDGPDDELPF